MLSHLARFLEAARDIERDRKTRPLVRQLERAVSTHFGTQRRLFLERLRMFKLQIDAPVVEALSPADWLAAWALAQSAAAAALEQQAMLVLLDALALGGADLLVDVDPDQLLGVVFGLDNPRAVEYARQRAAELVTLIDATTRDRLNTLLTHAIDQGWSYNRIADNITELFDDFSAGRAQRIAVYEIRDAYEGGNYLAAQQLQAEGLAMEKSWLTAGDAKVRPEHRENGAQSWIALDNEFSSGHLRPPTDPGCRCTLLIRRVSARRQAAARR